MDINFSDDELDLNPYDPNSQTKNVELEAEDEELDLGGDFDLPSDRFKPSSSGDFEDELDLGDFSSTGDDELDLGESPLIPAYNLPSDSVLLDDDYDPVASLYDSLEDENQEEDVFTDIEEEAEDVAPDKYSFDLYENYKEILDRKPTERIGQLSSRISENVTALFTKIVKEKGFRVKDSTTIMEVILQCERDPNFDEHQALEKFRKESQSSTLTRQFAYMFSDFRREYRKILEEDKLTKEKLSAPKKRLETIFYDALEASRDLLGMFIAHNKPISYFKDISFSQGVGYSYTCGGCGETHVLGRSPIMVLVLEADIRKDRDRSKNMKAFQKPIPCQCGALNIVRKSVFRNIELSLYSTYSENLQAWKDLGIKLNSVMNFFQYEPKSSLLSEVKGGVSVIEVEQVEEKEESFEELREWAIHRYKEALKYSSYSDKVKYEPTLTGEIETVRDSNLFEDLAKYLSLLSKEKYSNLIVMARGSLYTHLKESTPFFYALQEVSAKEIAIDEAEVLLDNPNLDKKILNRIGSLVGLYSESDLTIEMVKEAYEEYRKFRKEYDSNRDYILSRLNDMIKFFMFLPIKDFSYGEDINIIYSSESLSKWFDQVTNLMVITHLLPNFYHLWGSTHNGSSKNDSIFNPKKVPWDKRLAELDKNYRKSGYYTVDLIYGNLVNSFANLTNQPLILESSLLKTLSRRLDYVSFCLRVGRIVKPQVAELFEIYREFEPLVVESHKFLRDFDQSDASYYKFYYGDLFSDEEINSGVLELSGERIAPAYYVDRLENENLYDYIQRIKSMNGSNSNLRPSKFQEFFSRKVRMSFYLSALSAVKSYLDLHGLDKFQRYSFLSQVILLFPQFNRNKIYKFLGIPTPSNSSLNAVPMPPEMSREYHGFKNELMEVVVFTEESMNETRDTLIGTPNLHNEMKEEEGHDILLEKLSYSQRLVELL